MKHYSRLLIVVSVFALLGCAGGGEYVDGVYEGSGEGYYGQMVVEVSVDGGNIAEIEIVEAEDTPAMVDAVKNSLIPTIVEEQGYQGVDTVTGATGTSRGVLQAVEAALQGATDET